MGKREEGKTHRVLRDNTTGTAAGTGRMLHTIDLMVALRIQRLRIDAAEEEEESQRNSTPTLDATPRARRHDGAGAGRREDLPRRVKYMPTTLATRRQGGSRTLSGNRTEEPHEET